MKAAIKVDSPIAGKLEAALPDLCASYGCELVIVPASPASTCSLITLHGLPSSRYDGHTKSVDFKERAMKDSLAQTDSLLSDIRELVFGLEPTELKKIGIMRHGMHSYTDLQHFTPKQPAAA
jgi:hypothetical protein